MSDFKTEVTDQKHNKTAKHGNRIMLVAMIIIIAALIAVFVYQQYMIHQTKEAVSYSTYSKHYVLIPSEGDEALWDSIYQSAKEEGLKNDAYVECFGENLTSSYSRNQLFLMAIQAKVDGIILEGDDSQETTALINQATEAGIPVIAVLGDCVDSSRIAYVGINSYNIGQEYGEQIANMIGAKITDPKQILVISTSDFETSSQSRMLLGIRDYLSETYDSGLLTIDSESVAQTDDFATEEYMRQLFQNRDQLPDYLICLDSVSSVQAYQAAVDYNAVGQTCILGYYDSDTILSAVSKGVLNMTISLDTQAMGQLSVDALTEYQEMNFANGYQVVDFEVIDSRTAEDLLKEKEEE